MLTRHGTDQVDLDTSRCPRTCENFLKLCKAYRYNYLTFFSVQKNFLAQTGDPTNTGEGGQAIWSLLDPVAPCYSDVPYFYPERHRTLKHAKRGTVSMACRRLKPDEEDSLVAGSQFFVTLADGIEYLDDKHAPFGQIVEGDEEGDTLDKINAAFVDKDMRPLRDIRIRHVVVLDDPYDDPIGLRLPSRTPSPTPEQVAAIGLDASAPLDDDKDRPAEEVEEERRKHDTDAAALTLEMVGDLPFAEVRPPENILFVCKLNPVTRSEDLELIFSRFGKILSCEVICDKKTGDSLQYAFIEFDQRESAEQAYFKMQNVLVDDRRIWVDFSQSVSKLSSNWNTSRAHGKPLRVQQGLSERGHRSRSPSSSRRYDDVDHNQRRSRYAGAQHEDRFFGPPRASGPHDGRNSRRDDDRQRDRLARERDDDRRRDSSNSGRYSDQRYEHRRYDRGGMDSDRQRQRSPLRRRERDF